MGEYARCSAIARAVLQRWPRASVHFMLSREAPYASRVPFPATLLPSSPTFHTAAVIEHLRASRPDVVIFDNAGRGAQLEAAHRLGASVVYISSRRRQRRKAFRLSSMRALDEHWIAYPRFVAGDLSLVERAKLKLLGRPVIRYLDVIMARGEPSGTAPGGDVVVIPGGGTGHPGAGNVVAEFAAAARALAHGGFATTFVGPPDGGANDSEGAGARRAMMSEGLTGTQAQTPAAGVPRLEILESLPQAELAQRIARAKVVVVNGGSTLLQAIACGAACVAAPIAGDQLERIRRCVRSGVALEAAPERADIERKVRSLLEDESARAALGARAAGLGLEDGIEVALDALARLIRRA
jgi:hypothetical protein